VFYGCEPDNIPKRKMQRNSKGEAEMGKIKGYETQEKIAEKIREVAEFLNSIVKNVNEKGGIENLPYEEIKVLVDETIPEINLYFDSIEQYVSWQSNDVSLVDGLKEARPVLKELYSKAYLVKQGFEKEKGRSSLISPAGKPGTYKVKYMVFGENEPVSLTYKVPGGGTSQRSPVAVPYESAEYEFKGGEKLYISATNTLDKEITIRVAIHVDGQKRRDVTSWGGFMSATARMRAGDE